MHAGRLTLIVTCTVATATLSIATVTWQSDVASLRSKQERVRMRARQEQENAHTKQSLATESAAELSRSYSDFSASRDTLNELTEACAPLATRTSRIDGKVTVRATSSAQSRLEHQAEQVVARLDSTNEIIAYCRRSAS